MITGKQIKAVRSRIKESQAKFAARLGVDQATVHRWETYGPPKGGAAAFAIQQAIKEIGVLDERA
jgi:DNA-binding transcriptional regulator YiaG